MRRISFFTADPVRYTLLEDEVEEELSGGLDEDELLVDDRLGELLDDELRGGLDEEDDEDDDDSEDEGLLEDEDGLDELLWGGGLGPLEELLLDELLPWGGGAMAFFLLALWTFRTGARFGFFFFTTSSAPVAPDYVIGTPACKNFG